MVDRLLVLLFSISDANAIPVGGISMNILNLNVDHWDMLSAVPEQTELDFGNHDISAMADFISDPNTSDGTPWNYDASTVPWQREQRGAGKRGDS